MARVVAVANQKGGVAKTTTVHTLGEALGEKGKRVLLVDLDPQASLTFALGTDPEELHRSLHDVLLGRCAASDVLVNANGVDLVPATIDLAGTEVHLMTRTGREYALRKALAPLADDYDITLIDCPPSLGILTINGLTAATEVLIPLQCERLSQRGVGQLLETIDDVRNYTNPDLMVRGVIATLFDARTNLASQVLADVRDRHGLHLLEPPVPKSVKVAEAPGRGMSVLTHAPSSRSAAAYRELADLLARQDRSKPKRAAAASTRSN